MENYMAALGEYLSEQQHQIEKISNKVDDPHFQSEYLQIKKDQTLLDGLSNFKIEDKQDITILRETFEQLQYECNYQLHDFMQDLSDSSIDEVRESLAEYLCELREDISLKTETLLEVYSSSELDYEF